MNEPALVPADRWIQAMKKFAVLLAGALAATAPVMAAHASALTIDYYTIGETDADANHLAFGTFSNEVQNTLGPDGLPVLNTTQYGCVSGCISGSGLPCHQGTKMFSTLSPSRMPSWSMSVNDFFSEAAAKTMSFPPPAAPLVDDDVDDALFDEPHPLTMPITSAAAAAMRTAFFTTVLLGFRRSRWWL